MKLYFWKKKTGREVQSSTSGRRTKINNNYFFSEEFLKTVKNETFTSGNLRDNCHITYTLLS